MTALPLERFRAALAALRLTLPEDATVLGDLMALFDELRRRGAVIVVKYDGERSQEAGEQPYTLVITRGDLPTDAYVHFEDDDLVTLIHRGLIDYAEQLLRS